MTLRIQYPTGQGSVACITFGSGSYNWDRIAEETADDSDGIQCNNTNRWNYYLDRITFPALGISGTINSVRLYGRIALMGGASVAAACKFGLYIGTTDYYGTEWAHEHTSFTEHYNEWTVNPASSPDPFTVAVLDAASYDIALREGYTATGEKTADVFQAYCSQFWRVVDYTASEGGIITDKFFLFMGR